jgi:hypothetical protein
MRIPITLISKTHLKTIKTTAVIDSGASGTFISKSFVKEHGITTHSLKEPFRVNNTNEPIPKKGLLCIIVSSL